MVNMNDLHAHEVDILGGTIVLNPDLIFKADPDLVIKFCTLSIGASLTVHNTLFFFRICSYVYTIGMLANVVQKFVILRFKDNVSLNMFQLLIEIFGVLVGTLYIFAVRTSNSIGDVSRECEEHTNFTQEELMIMETVQGLKTSIITNTGLNYPFIMSAFIVQLVLVIVVILQRSNYSGELI